jgi:hypothetical protein
MRPLGLALVALIAILATGIAVPTALAGIADQGWWFPGDPPMLDLALPPAALGFLGAAFVWWRLTVLRRTDGAPRLLLVLSAAVTASAAVALAACAAGIGFRQSTAWSDLRHAIRQAGDAVAADVSDPSAVLGRAEFEALRQKHVPRPIEITLRGFGSVRLRMAHAIYPYVGVDFGEGRHAFFEPRSMTCTYSD